LDNCFGDAGSIVAVVVADHTTVDQTDHMNYKMVEMTALDHKMVEPGHMTAGLDHKMLELIELAQIGHKMVGPGYMMVELDYKMVEPIELARIDHKMVEMTVHKFVFAVVEQFEEPGYTTPVVENRTVELVLFAQLVDHMIADYRIVEAGMKTELVTIGRTTGVTFEIDLVTSFHSV